MKKYLDAVNAMMQKPDGDAYSYCGSCRGEGCRLCRGWGWVMNPGHCLLPATGKACGDCPKRKGCQR